jgi:hypothetical protein
LIGEFLLDTASLLYCAGLTCIYLSHIDSALVRGQEHELMQNNIPFTDTTFASLLATGSVLTSFLFEIFVKPMPFDERGQKSLMIVAAVSVADILSKEGEDGDLSTTELTLLVFNGNLTVNPDNYNALIADSDTEACTFTVGMNVSTDDQFATVLRQKLLLCPNIGTVCSPETCQQDEDGNFYGCACNLVVGVDAKSLTFISTVAYSDAAKKIRNDIQLLGLYNASNTDTENSVLGFPLNSPITPSLIPRFRSFQNFSDFINEALARVMEGVTVSFEYSPGDSTTTPHKDPTFLINIVFTRKKSFGVAFDGSVGLGGMWSFYEFNNYVLKE